MHRRLRSDHRAGHLAIADPYVSRVADPVTGPEQAQVELEVLGRAQLFAEPAERPNHLGAQHRGAGDEGGLPLRGREGHAVQRPGRGRPGVRPTFLRHRPPVAVDPGATGVVLGGVQPLGQRAGPEEVVRVEKGHPRCPRVAQPGVAGCGQPGVALVLDHPEPAVHRGVGGRHVNRQVGRPVVHHHTLEVGQVLADQAAQRLAEVLAVVEGGDHHGDRRPPPGRRLVPVPLRRQVGAGRPPGAVAAEVRAEQPVRPEQNADQQDAGRPGQQHPAQPPGLRRPGRRSEQQQRQCDEPEKHGEQGGGGLPAGSSADQVGGRVQHRGEPGAQSGRGDPAVQRVHGLEPVGDGSAWHRTRVTP